MRQRGASNGTVFGFVRAVREELVDAPVTFPEDGVICTSSLVDRIKICENERQAIRSYLIERRLLEVSLSLL